MIHFASVPNSDNQHGQYGIMDFINNAIIPYADAVRVFEAFEFYASGRAGIIGKCVNVI